MDAQVHRAARQRWPEPEARRTICTPTNALHTHILIRLQIQWHAGGGRSADLASLKRGPGLPSLIVSVFLPDDRELPPPTARDFLKYNRPQLGFYNISTARLLCPRNDRDIFDEDPEQYCRSLISSSCFSLTACPSGIARTSISSTYTSRQRGSRHSSSAKALSTRRNRLPSYAGVSLLRWVLAICSTSDIANACQAYRYLYMGPSSVHDHPGTMRSGGTVDHRYLFPRIHHHAGNDRNGLLPCASLSSR